MVRSLLRLYYYYYYCYYYTEQNDWIWYRIWFYWNKIWNIPVASKASESGYIRSDTLLCIKQWSV